MVNHYYQKRKERIQKKAEEGYQNLCKEEKDKRRKRARERYQNFTAKEKEKLVSIIRNVRTSFLTIEEIII